MIKKEYLLREEHNRYTTFPIIHKDIWEAYKTQMSFYWIAEEIDFN